MPKFKPGDKVVVTSPVVHFLGELTDYARIVASVPGVGPAPSVGERGLIKDGPDLEGDWAVYFPQRDVEQWVSEEGLLNEDADTPLAEVVSIFTGERQEPQGDPFGSDRISDDLASILGPEQTGPVVVRRGMPTPTEGERFVQLRAFAMDNAAHCLAAAGVQADVMDLINAARYIMAEQLEWYVAPDDQGEESHG